MSTIGERIRKKRIESNLTQEQLAQKMGYKTRGSINKIENDVTELTPSKIKRLAEIFNCPISYLIDDSPVFTVSGEDNNSSQSNNNSGTITTITNNYPDSCPTRSLKEAASNTVYQKEIKTLYAIIDELKKMSDGDMQRVLEYSKLLTK